MPVVTVERRKAAYGRSRMRNDSLEDTLTQKFSTRSPFFSWCWVCRGCCRGILLRLHRLCVFVTSAVVVMCQLTCRCWVWVPFELWMFFEFRVWVHWNQDLDYVFVLRDLFFGLQINICFYIRNLIWCLSVCCWPKFSETKISASVVGHLCLFISLSVYLHPTAHNLIAIFPLYTGKHCAREKLISFWGK